jgi:hypothetical protein
MDVGQALIVSTVSQQVKAQRLIQEAHPCTTSSPVDVFAEGGQISAALLSSVKLCSSTMSANTQGTLHFNSATASANHYAAPLDVSTESRQVCCQALLVSNVSQHTAEARQPRRRLSRQQQPCLGHAGS